MQKYGHPQIAARMPAPVIRALKQMAHDQNRTPSDILRELTIKELKRAGYPVTQKEGEGYSA